MGSSTYALSTMLSVFMAGLSIGGLVGARFAPRLEKPERVFALSELGIGVTGLLTVPAIRAMTPLYIASFYAFHLSFNAFSVVQFFIVFLVMGIPTTLMGLTFPVAVRYFTLNRQEASRESGHLYFINTLGAIAGSLSAGFLLVPLFGNKWAAVTAATLNIASACVILFLSRTGTRTFRAALLLLLGAPAVLGATYPEKIPFFSYYSAYRFDSYKRATSLIDEILNSDRHRILYHREGVDGEVYLTKFEDYYVLFNNGKLELGDDTGFRLLAQLPWALHSSRSVPRKILSIGLGSGHTLRNLASLPAEQIDSVEINRDIMEVNRTLLNPELFTTPRIRHVEADGRNYLLLNREKYDIIVASPSWAVEPSSGSLLTREFFSLVQDRLYPAGVFALWVDYFLMTEEDLRTLLRTLSGSFRHVTAWHINGDNMILVGTNVDTGRSYTSIMADINRKYPSLDGIYRLAYSPLMVRAIPTGPVNSDDHPLIEFSNARNIIIGRAELFRQKLSEKDT